MEVKEVHMAEKVGQPLVPLQFAMSHDKYFSVGVMQNYCSPLKFQFLYQ